jgi:hypothetical protein
MYVEKKLHIKINGKKLNEKSIHRESNGLSLSAIKPHIRSLNWID